MRNKRIALFTLCTTICALPSCTGFNSFNVYAPVFSADGKTVKYGYYPQTHVNDPLLIQELNEIETPVFNGWYLYKGTYYTKKRVSFDGATFDDGTAIVSQMTYWFRCEPIKWNILKTSKGTYNLVSSMLLDVHEYNNEYWEGTKAGKYATNYADSEIRGWLNDTFYDIAFGLDDSFIQTTRIDNSASTTDSLSNKFICENTNDKVYLLSYQDYLNADYGYSISIDESETRTCQTTEWARASNAHCYGGNFADKYNGSYWTRSPFSSHKYRGFSYSYDLVSKIYTTGDIGVGYVCREYECVRPAITIKIS